MWAIRPAEYLVGCLFWNCMTVDERIKLSFLLIVYFLISFYSTMQYPVPSSRQIFSTINLEGLIPQTRVWVSQENSLRGSFGLSALFYNVLLKSCFNTGDLFISEGWAGFGGENLKKIENFGGEKSGGGFKL